MEPNTIPTSKLIDAADFFQEQTWANQGRRALKSIPPETATQIVAYVLTLAVAECRAGLGMASEIDIDYDLPIFQIINQVYEEFAGDCYFFSKGIDPNEVEVNQETKICAICKLKMANFAQTLGIAPEKLITGIVGKRKVQKTRLKNKGPGSKPTP